MGQPPASLPSLSCQFEMVAHDTLAHNYTCKNAITMIHLINQMGCPIKVQPLFLGYHMHLNIDRSYDLIGVYMGSWPLN